MNTGSGSYFHWLSFIRACKNCSIMGRNLCLCHYLVWINQCLWLVSLLVALNYYQERVEWVQADVKDEKKDDEVDEKDDDMDDKDDEMDKEEDEIDMGKREFQP